MSKEGLAEMAKDGSLGGAAITTPFWLQYAEFWIQHCAIFIGAILLVMRLILAIREFCKKGDG